MYDRISIEMLSDLYYYFDYFKIFVSKIRKSLVILIPSVFKDGNHISKIIFI